jgi:hypothetical protein
MKRLFAALAFLTLATPAWAANFNQPSAGCGGDPKWGLPPCDSPAPRPTTAAPLITLICIGQAYNMLSGGKPISGAAKYVERHTCSASDPVKK